MFTKAEASDFLNNRAEITWAGASFDWLMGKENFSKAINGRFDNQAKKKPKETIKGTNVAMSIVADGTREDYKEPEVHFE